jgi:hypothetical protein
MDLASIVRDVLALAAQRQRDAIDALQSIQPVDVTPAIPRTTPREATPALALMRELRSAGRSYETIAEELNRRGVPTARRGRWYAATVSNALRHA